MRESPTFRAELEQINVRYPKQEMLKIHEVADYMGISINTAKKRFPFIRKSETHKGGCTKVQLAQELSRRTSC